MNNVKIITDSIKSVLTDKPMVHNSDLTESDYHEIFNIAKAHDMLPMVSEGLYKNGLLPDNEIGDAIKNSQMTALIQFTLFEQERTKIAEALENEKIKFVFLKGSEINKYYPENYMRTQCDIDVLVSRDDLERAERVFVEKIGYKKTSVEHHEISFYTPSNVHIELHFFLEEEHKEIIDKALLNVWEYVYAENDRPYKMYMNNVFFLFYHIAHMEKHFINGGCGIKPFVDLWIIKHRMNVNFEEVKPLLEKCNLYTFYCQSVYLSEVWFGNMTHKDISRKMEHYILNAGAYGTPENNAAMAQCRKGSKAKHLAERIFLPYKTITEYYPIVRKYHVLLPFAHIYRWCKVLFGKGRVGAFNEINLNLKINDEKQNEVMSLCKELNL